MNTDVQPKDLRELTFPGQLAVLRLLAGDDLLHQLVVAAAAHRLHDVLHLRGGRKGLWNPQRWRLKRVGKHLELELSHVFCKHDFVANCHFIAVWWVDVHVQMISPINSCRSNTHKPVSRLTLEYVFMLISQNL